MFRENIEFKYYLNIHYSWSFEKSCIIGKINHGSSPSKVFAQESSLFIGPWSWSVNTGVAKKKTISNLWLSRRDTYFHRRFSLKKSQLLYFFVHSSFFYFCWKCLGCSHKILFCCQFLKGTQVRKLHKYIDYMSVTKFQVNVLEYVHKFYLYALCKISAILKLKIHWIIVMIYQAFWKGRFQWVQFLFITLMMLFLTPTVYLTRPIDNCH